MWKKTVELDLKKKFLEMCNINNCLKIIVN